MTRHDRIGTFQELVDLEAMQQVQDDFSAAVGLATYILDPDGQVLTRSGWSDLCAEFHHRSPVGSARCRESRQGIFAEVAQKRGAVLRVCANGLAIAAVPILVAQRQLATLVVSQVFLTPPDENRFRAQALELGLEVEPYLAAVRRIRVLPEDEFLQQARLVGNVARLVSNLGRQNWEQKLLDEQLQREKAYLEAVFQGSGDGMRIIDVDFRVVRQNREMERLFGVAGYHAVGRKCFRSFKHPFCESENCVLRRILAGERRIRLEVEKVRPDGRKIAISLVATPLKGASGEVTGVIESFRDITERRQHQEELQRANEELELANEELVAVNEELVAADEELKQQVWELEQSRNALMSANQKLLDIVEFLPDPTFVIDRDRKVIAWNRAIEELTGIPKKDMLDRGDYAYAVPFYGEPRPVLIDLIDAGDHEIEKHYEHVEKKGNILYAEVFVPSIRGGQGAFLWATAAALFDRWGNPVGAIESIRDISEYKRVQKELELQKAYFQQLFENSLAGIVMLDNADRVLRANKGFQNLFQYSLDEAVGCNVQELVVPESLLDEASALSRAISDGKVAQKESVRRRKDGSLVEVSVRGYPIVVDNKPVGRYMIYNDISERKRAEEQLKYLSLHDSLTGIFNRNYFEQEMRRLAEGRSRSVGVIICDVDGLKLTNDALGHSAGDALLKAAADAIRGSFRGGDVVARVGGDEFAVLLPGSDRETVENGIRRIREAVESYNAKNPELPLGVSIGFAVSNDVQVNMDELFKKADNNMYREKLHHGRSTHSAIVQALTQMLSARDFITGGHADRLQGWVLGMAAVCELSERNRADLRLLARFHDLGKVGVPDRILFKPGPLTPEEAAEMQRHCEIGHRIALSVPDLIPIADWILKHHEWWNGKGYPLGLEGEAIPLECRILAVVDAYDAMTNNRPYRKAMPHAEAVAELRRCAGTQFDPQLVEKFLQLLADREPV